MACEAWGQGCRQTPNLDPLVTEGSKIAAMEVELLEIGRFSSMSGLSVAALRHYDDVGMLKPRVVNPRTSYRRYHPDQVGDARLICSLRGVDLPIEEIRHVLASDSAAETTTILLRHQRRLAERAERLDRMIATSHAYINQGLPLPTPSGSRVVQVAVSTTDLDMSVRFYSTVFGLTFEPDISSFQLGAWETDTFFLLTIENWLDNATPSSFGMLVDDVDAIHRTALDHGAAEVSPPADYAWKPRSSVIDDPSGNRIQLSQA
jgi:DNA-binding transcriptional MerR regulator